MRDRGFFGNQFVGLVLREIADPQLRSAPHLAGQRCQPPGQQFRQRGLAVAVGAEQRDAVVHVDRQRDVAQHGRVVVADGDALQRQDRRGDARGLGKVEASGRVLDHVVDLRQAGERLDARLRLARLARLVAEAVDERLDVRAFGGDALDGAGLLHGALGADADEFVEAAGGERDLAAVEERDRLHRAVQQAAVVRDQQCGAGEAGEPAFQPERCLQVEVVGRFVEQQQVGVGEQRGRQGHAHAPAAGEFLDRARLGGLVEAQAGEDGGGAGRSCIGADRAQAFVDLGQAVRFGGVRLGEQCEAFGVALQHGVEQGRVAGGGFLARRSRCARARRGGCRRRPAGVRRMIARSRVDLPAPLRPTRPMRRPGSTVRSAPSRMGRPPRRMVAPVMTRSDMAAG